MKTIIIPNTKNRLSLREDGVVYYTDTGRIKNPKKSGAYRIKINNKNKEIWINKLMREYFHVNCANENCNNLITNSKKKVCKECSYKSSKIYGIININKYYAANSLNLKKKELTDELYNFYKAQLLVKRKLVEKTGLHIQNFK